MATEKIEIKLEADTSGLKQGLKAGEDFARDTKKKLDKDTLYKLRADVATLKIELDNARALLRKAKKEGDADAVFDLEIKTQKLQSGLTEAKRQLNNFQNTGDKSLSRLQSKFDQVTSRMDRFKQKALDASAALRAIGGAAVVAGLTSISKSAIKVAASFEQYEVVLTNALGSQQKAQESLALIEDLASKTPFQLNQLTESYIKLVNRGIQPTANEITKLGDLASSQGKDFDQLVEALLDAQTGEFERLKEFGIKARSEGDKVTFIFRGQQIQVDKTEQAIKDYILSLGEVQGISGSMEAISGTLNGRISNLQDSFASLAKSVGGLFTPALKSAIDFLIPIVDRIKEFAQENPKLTATIAGLTLVVGGLGASLLVIAPILPLLISGFGTIGVVLAGLAAPVAVVTGLLTTLFLVMKDGKEEGLSFVDTFISLFKKLSFAIGTSINAIVFFFQDLFLKGTAIFKDLYANIGDIVDNILTLFSNLAQNIGVVFSNIPLVIKGVMNDVVGAIEGGINGSIRGLNKLTSVLKKIPKIGDDFANVLNIGEIDLGKPFSVGTPKELKAISSGLKDIEMKNTEIAFEESEKRAKATAEGIRQSYQEYADWVDSRKKGEQEVTKTIQDSVNSQIQAQKELTKKANGGGTVGQTREQKIAEAKAKYEAEIEEKKQKNRQDLIKSAQDVIDSEIKKSEGVIEDYQKKIEDTADAFAKLKEDAEKQIDEINTKLRELETGRETTIASRVIEIQDKLKEEELDPEERIKLEKELALARANTTEQAIAEAQRQAGLSTTEKILEEIALEKQRLEEKKLSIETELALQEAQANTEIEVLTSKLESEQALFEKLSNAKVKAEQKATQELEVETQKQVGQVQRLQEEMRKLIELRRQANLDTGASTGSQTAPSVTNNSKNISQNIVINNDVDGQALLNSINKKIG